MSVARESVEAAISDGFTRKFGNVYHYAWLEGVPGTDFHETSKNVAAFAGNLAKELGVSGAFGFQVFQSLNSINPHGEALWLEKYEDIQAWAMAELAAQRSSTWMAMILGSEHAQTSVNGESNAIIDDSLSECERIESETLSIDWTVLSPSKLEALISLPPLVEEFSEIMRSAGHSDSTVRFLGMTTSAGAEPNLGHFWIESPTPTCMAELLSWRQTAPELKVWRHKLASVCREIKSHHLLTRIA